MTLQNINKYINTHNELPYLQLISYFSNYIILFITNHLLLNSYIDIYLSSQIILLFHMYVQYHRETHLLTNYMYRDFISNKKVTLRVPSYYVVSLYIFIIIYSSIFIINCYLLTNLGLSLIHTIASTTIIVKTYYNINYNRSLFSRPIYYYSHKPRNSFIEHFTNIEYPTEVYM